MEAHTEVCTEDLLDIHSILRSTDILSPIAGIFIRDPRKRPHDKDIEVIAKIYAMNSHVEHVEHRWFRRQYTCRVFCSVLIPAEEDRGPSYRRSVCSWEAGTWNTSIRAQESNSYFARFSTPKAGDSLDKELLRRSHDEL